MQTVNVAVLGALFAGPFHSRLLAFSVCPAPVPQLPCSILWNPLFSGCRGGWWGECRCAQLESTAAPLLQTLHMHEAKALTKPWRGTAVDSQPDRA